MRPLPLVSLLALVFLQSTPAGAALGPVLLGPGRTHTVVGDHNADGLQDVAFTLPATNKVVTLLGTSGGAFTSRREYTTGLAPGELAIGDVNGDSQLDLVIASTGQNRLTVLLGNGDGSFTPGTDLGIGGNGRTVALGDVDGDGDLDLVYGMESPLALVLQLGHGDGTFGSPVTLVTPLARPADLQLVDLDSDDHLDVLALTLHEELITILGDGLGAFGSPTTTTLPFSFIFSSAPPNNRPYRIIPAEPMRLRRSPSGVNTAWIYSPHPEWLNGIWSLWDTKSYYVAAFDGSGGFSSLFRFFEGAAQPEATPVFGLIQLPGRASADWVLKTTGGALVHELVGRPNVSIATPSAAIDIAATDVNGDALDDVLVVGEDGNVYATLSPGRPDAPYSSVPFGTPPPHVVAAAAGPGGTIRPMGTLPTGHRGTRVFEILPGSTHTVSDVIVDGVSVGPATTYTFSDVTGDHTIEAQFAPAGMPIAFDLKPETIKLGSSGMKYVHAFLEPPPPFAAASIDIASIRLNNVVAVDLTAPVPSSIGDEDHDGIADLRVSFSRDALLLHLPVGDEVPVEVTCSIGTQAFFGHDDVRIKSGRITNPASHAVLAPGAWVPLVYDVTSPSASWVALMFSPDGGASWTMPMTTAPNSGTLEWRVPNRLTDDARVAVAEVEVGAVGSIQVEGVLAVSERFSIQGALDVPGARPVTVLLPPRPNPSSGAVNLGFSMAQAGEADVTVFDALGRQVAQPARGHYAVGVHQAIWNGRWDRGSEAQPGLYFVRLRAGGHVLQERMIRLE